jgi:hypothetical protein
VLERDGAFEIVVEDREALEGLAQRLPSDAAPKAGPRSEADAPTWARASLAELLEAAP